MTSKRNNFSSKTSIYCGIWVSTSSHVKHSSRGVLGKGFLKICSKFRAGDTGGPGGTCSPPLFLRGKKKKGKQRKARKNFKAETIKRLSLRSKLYCLSHSRESRIHKFFLPATMVACFAVLHGSCTLKSISPALKFTGEHPYRSVISIKLGVFL